MPRAVLALGLVIAVVIGGGVAYLVLGDAAPAPSDVPERREAERPPIDRFPGLPLDRPPEPEPIDEAREARIALWSTAIDHHEAGRVVAALEIVARLRAEDPEFLAEPGRAERIAEMEEAALALVQRALDRNRLVTAARLAGALEGLVVDPGLLGVVEEKVADAKGRLSRKRRAEEGRLLGRARRKGERQTLIRHLERFGSSGRSRGKRRPTPTDRTLEAVAEREEGKPIPVLPVPDVDEVEKRRMEQLEKLRQRDAVGLLDHIAAGLAWLALHQADDGRITETSAKARCKELGHKSCPGLGSERFPIASTALSVIAFLDFRDQDAEGLFEPALARGVTWLLAQQKKDGSFPSSRMYSHAIAVMAMGQAATSTGREDLRVSVEKGLAWLATKPGPSGGYRYRLGQAGDLSVSGWVVQGYEMAGLCEAKVPAGFANGLRGFWSTVWLGEGRFAYLAAGPERRNLAPVGMLMAHLLDHPTALGLEPTWRRSLATWPGRPTLYALYYGVRMLLALDGKLPKRWNDWVLELAGNQTAKGPAAGSFSSKSRWKVGAKELTTRTAFSVLTLEHSLYRR